MEFELAKSGELCVVRFMIHQAVCVTSELVITIEGVDWDTWGIVGRVAERFARPRSWRFLRESGCFYDSPPTLHVLNKDTLCLEGTLEPKKYRLGVPLYLAEYVLSCVT
ncbi:hypothetical protein CEXT_527501 [Caerostris extrusa]|uniref:Uncharacterized protein n=1 Tax=Caerostris extrusa TaxID=172846 RepID=A0AAV4RSN2_CAEEX|nr:hypothetical protein CEXT_527501 [Caerostris extrusa]